MMEFVKQSPLTGNVNTRFIDVTPEEFSRWYNDGVLIQNAMPRASADDREFIMTGYTPEDWEEMFGESEGSEEFLNQD